MKRKSGFRAILGNKKGGRPKAPSFLPEYFIFVIGNYVFDLPDRQIKLFGQRLETDPVYESTFENRAVTFRVQAVYVLVDGLGDLRVGRFSHSLSLNAYSAGASADVAPAIS